MNDIVAADDTVRLPEPDTKRFDEAPSAKKLSARERLLRAADELFYGQGINTTGVEGISSHAGVTKATLYNNFSGKEELVAAYLDRRLVRWLLDARRADDPEKTGESRVAALFTLLQRSVEASNFRGCPFTNASIERPESSLVSEVVSHYRDELVNHVTAMLTGPDARERADLIVMLYDGALVSAKTSGDTDAVDRARRFAERLAMSSDSGLTPRRA